MALQDPTLPTRLVICVDGTQSSSTSNKHGGPLTNIHRIYAATELGKCLDPIAATRFNQKVQYVPGIGAADNAISTDRIQANVFGSGYLKQVQEVYESCCKLDGVKGDEVWLFGFSRGAYVVRAVAGLLDQWGALSSAGQPEFSRDFKRALKKTEGMQGRLSLALSPVRYGSFVECTPTNANQDRILYIFIWHEDYPKNTIRRRVRYHQCHQR